MDVWPFWPVRGAILNGSIRPGIMHNTAMSPADIQGRAEMRTCLEPSPDENADLVTKIMRLRAGIGDGLNDFEFTEFLKSRLVESENGFQALCFSEGCVTFSVPAQKPADWYAANCRIGQVKEIIARDIATQHR